VLPHRALPLVPPRPCPYPSRSRSQRHSLPARHHQNDGILPHPDRACDRTCRRRSLGPVRACRAHAASSLTLLGESAGWISAEVTGADGADADF
jgi:hypothetical protein